jgi:hypothetical protein
VTTLAEERGKEHRWFFVGAALLAITFATVVLADVVRIP